ncbi:unnamed protein product [Linum tenue]|uniref:Uncharacterized protein n=1 Tax=Linum tenue TaxID=586396 RepID=A0AAV0S670_9ROSI|nr:unnamed protein product [Linum tenue]
MKLKNKGKVFPSPSAAAASSDFLSVLSLLPAAILALASVLSLPDREVLAYMLTMSLKSTPPSSLSTTKKSSKKPSSNHAAGSGSTSSGPPHKAPVFGCDCFDCYTSYWFRWDSSPNRELIHQVIEAFEEHLLTAEQPKKSKRRDKTSRRVAAAAVEIASDSKLNQLLPPPPPQVTTTTDEPAASFAPAEIEVETVSPAASEEEERAVVLRLPPAAEGGSGHKGIGRKVLPDVFGLLNSRLWSLWGPNI